MLGYIDNRLKYVARRSKAFIAETTDGDQSTTTAVIENNDEELPTTSGETDTTMRDLINDMKSWTIHANDIISMKTNLRKTRDYRQKMLLNEKTDLLESFAYFFVNTDLVII